MKSCGLANASTFRGFCATHDSALFKPIETIGLVPTPEQVALYAYRALCRELVAKENASELIESLSAGSIAGRGWQQLLDWHREGTRFGLLNLWRQKQVFDDSLREHRYRDFEYMVFYFRQKPVVAFSSVFYPEFDFLGRPLQDLRDHNQQLNLLAVSSARMEGGWGLLLAWHVTSSDTCRELIASLVDGHCENDSLESALFRIVFKSCENLAVAPEWWESLCREKQESILSALTPRPFAPVAYNYLLSGLDGLTDWKVASVYDSRVGA